MQKYLVKIEKEREFDVKAKKVEAECFDLLDKKVEVSTSTCYEIEGDLSDIKNIVESYILDPTIEKYSIYSSMKEIIENHTEGVYIIVSFRKGVTNPDDEIIFSFFKRILGDKIKSFRTISLYIFRNINREEANLIAEKILSNELIHQVEIVA